MEDILQSIRGLINEREAEVEAAPARAWEDTPVVNEPLGASPAETSKDPAVSSRASEPDVAERLTSPVTEELVAVALAKLGSSSMGGGDRQLRDVVADMARPLIAEWLNENLARVTNEAVSKALKKVV